MQNTVTQVRTMRNRRGGGREEEEAEPRRREKKKCKCEENNYIYHEAAPFILDVTSDVTGQLWR